MSQIDAEVLEKEIAIQNSINGCVDEYKSFRFNAGAGAGKTYALIETIRHIAQTKYSSLSKINQQVICITYTNVAVKEIRKRLGESELVIVSTIHERLWELIKIHQPELLKIHQEKLEAELAKLDADLANQEDKNYQTYAKLSHDDQMRIPIKSAISSCSKPTQSIMQHLPSFPFQNRHSTQVYIKRMSISGKDVDS